MHCAVIPWSSFCSFEAKEKYFGMKRRSEFRSWVWTNFTGIFSSVFRKESKIIIFYYLFVHPICWKSFIISILRRLDESVYLSITFLLINFETFCLIGHFGAIEILKVYLLEFNWKLPVKRKFFGKFNWAVDFLAARMKLCICGLLLLVSSR